MQNLDNCLNTFRIILNDSNCSLPLVISFLQANDLESLLQACRPLAVNNGSIRLILNSIHFFRYIWFDHTLNMMWGYDKRQSFQGEGSNTQAIFNLQQVRYGKLYRKAGCATQTLLTELAKVVSYEQANAIVSDVLETFRQGPLVTPHLRGKNVGMHANSPIQYYYCDILTLDNTHREEDHIYDTLRDYIYANQELFTETARSPKTNLKNMRFLSDQTTCYNEVPCGLVNLVNLLLTICDTHIQGIYQYLKSIKSDCERMTYFISYYNNFRKSIISLNEKLGFLFNQLHFTFEEIYSEWKGLPVYSLITIMLKKWLNRMVQFHEQFNNLFSLLLIKYRQSRLLINKENGDMFSKTVFNNEFACKSMTATSYSCILEHKLQFQADGFMEIINRDSVALRYLTHHYSQYLMDLSVNEFNVHMNGHSQQYIGQVYKQAEATVIIDSISFHKHLFTQLENLPAAKLLIEADIQTLKDLTKPITLKKIVNNANQYLNEWKENIMVSEDRQQASVLHAFLSGQSQVAFPFGKQDRRIESMMENFRIPHQLPDETSELYDLTCIPDVRKLEKMFDVCESIIDPDELQAYYSEGENVDEECQQGLLNQQHSIAGQSEEALNEKQDSMDIEYECLRMQKSVESTREAEIVSLEGDIEIGKRQRQYEMECQQELLNLKRLKMSPQSHN